MSYRLSVGFASRGARDRESMFDGIRAADEAGVDSVWVAESWGEDAFTLMGQIVERTERINVGTAIINVFSRTPAAIAQHFATLDSVSEGRMIVGLGTSGANVIEHFHGIPFKRPIARLREYVEIINILMSGEKLDYSGEFFELHRGFTLNMSRFRDHIPVYLATLAPASVQLTAEIADGWLPIWTPIGELPAVAKAVRDQSVAAGRPADAVTIRSPGGVTLTNDVESARAATAGAFAFYVARMGKFYANHLTRIGHGDVVEKVRAAWEDGGSGAAAAAVPPDLQQSLGLVTDSVEQARDRLAEQEAAGVRLHSMNVSPGRGIDLRKTFEALMR
ncbi:MAG TPA: LLM class flavin-dependent oxidoreductase [Dehalococcoidia bacterium]|nr:LLM class flavin-dependent oxidoreductase [Dehalococcoidia bacterium]